MRLNVITQSGWRYYTRGDISVIAILPLSVIQIPWLGIAFVQGYLLKKDYNRSFQEIIRSRART